MKTKDKVQLAKQLLPIMPNFTIKGSMMFIQPMGHILRGVYFENSAFDTSIYVWVFLMPLFVPTPHIYFNFGYRIPRPNKTSWHPDSADFLDDLKKALTKNLPFLNNINALDDFIRSLKSHNSLQNLHVQEALAYTLALKGDTTKSITTLSTLIPKFDPTSHWQLEMQERARTLKAALEKNPPEAIDLLKHWEHASLPADARSPKQGFAALRGMLKSAGTQPANFLNNGLNDQDNRRLLSTIDPTEAVRLVLRGLSNVM